MGVLTSNEMSGASERLDLGAGKLGDVALEIESEAGADRVGVVALDDGIHHGPGADLDMAQETVLMVGAAVQVKDNLRILDFDIGEHEAVAGLGGCALLGDHVQIRFAGRLQLAVGDQGQALVSLGERPHGKALLRLHGAHDFQAGLGVQGGLGEIDMRGFDLGEAAVDGGGLVAGGRVPASVRW